MSQNKNEMYYLKEILALTISSSNLTKVDKKKILIMAEDSSASDVKEFISNFVNLKHDIQKIEYLLYVRDKDFKEHQSFYKKITSNNLFKEENNDLLNTVSEFITERNNNLQKGSDIPIPVIMDITDVAQKLVDMQNIFVIAQNLRKNNKLNSSEINHPEFLSFIDAFTSKDTERLERLFNYHKSLGDKPYFATNDMDIKDYTLNMLQAAIAYKHLSPEVKSNFKHIGLNRLVPILISPFYERSISFSFDPQKDSELNVFTPNNFHKNKDLYENMFLGAYHYQNIKDLREEYKYTNNELGNLSRKKLAELYFSGELKKSTLQKRIEVGKLNENMDVLNLISERFDVNLNLIEQINSKDKVRGSIFSIKDSNNTVISSFMRGAYLINDIINKIHEVNLTDDHKMQEGDKDNLQIIREMRLIANGLRDYLIKKHSNKEGDSLIEVSANGNIKNLNTKFLLTRDLLREKVVIGNQEKSFGGWMRALGENKRDLKKGIDFSKNLDSKDTNKISKQMVGFLSGIDKAVDAIYTYYSTKKYNNQEENRQALKKYNIKNSVYEFFGSETYLNDYKTNFQNDRVGAGYYYLEKSGKGLTALITGGTSVALKMISSNIQKNLLNIIAQKDIVTHNHSSGIDPLFIFDDRISEKISKDSKVRIWAMSSVIRDDMYESPNRLTKTSKSLNISDEYTKQEGFSLDNMVSQLSEKLIKHKSQSDTELTEKSKLSMQKKM